MRKSNRSEGILVIREEAIAKSLAGDLPLASKFRTLLERLHRPCAITRALLLLAEPEKDRLSTYALWESGQLRTGVHLIIPRQDSALWELLETSCAKTITPPAELQGNFIEKQLLTSSQSGTLTIYPLISGGQRLGLICLNSNGSAPEGIAFARVQSAISCFSSAVERSLEFTSTELHPA